ncbi:MAG: YncE family protein [Vicinamibacterales bacterium]
MRLACIAGIMVALAVTSGATQGVRDTLLVVVNRAPALATIYRVEVNGLTRLDAVAVGKGPREVCVSPDGRRAYVGNQGASSVTAIDLATRKVIATIDDPALAGADGCVVSADSSRVYVAPSGAAAVAVIGADTLAVVQKIPVPLKVLRRVTFSPDGQRLYVTSNQTPDIAEVDVKTGALTRTIRVGREPRGGLGFLKDGTIVAGSVEDDTLYFLDPATGAVKRIIGVPASPQRIAVSPSGVLYVLCRIGQKLSGEVSRPTLLAIFNPEKHDESVAADVAQAPWGLAMTASGDRLFVSSNSGDTVQIVDGKTMKVLATVPTDKDPNGLAVRQ